jgi:hypothetical protein
MLSRRMNHFGEDAEAKLDKERGRQNSPVNEYVAVPPVMFVR